MEVPRMNTSESSARNVLLSSFFQSTVLTRSAVGGPNVHIHVLTHISLGTGHERKLEN